MEFGIIVLLVLVLYGLSFYWNWQRSQTIQAIAAQWGYTYRDKGRYCLPAAVNQSRLFSKGRSGRVNNLIQRENDDVTVSVGEYFYTTGSGKNRCRHRQTVVFIHSHALSLPQFVLVPENMFHKVGKLFGYQDIDFSAHPEFSKRFLLRGHNEVGIREQFHDGVISVLEQHPRVCVEGIGSTLMYYQDNHMHNPKKWQQLIADAFRVYEQFCLS